MEMKDRCNAAGIPADWGFTGAAPGADPLAAGMWFPALQNYGLSVAATAGDDMSWAPLPAQLPHFTADSGFGGGMASAFGGLNPYSLQPKNSWSQGKNLAGQGVDARDVKRSAEVSAEHRDNAPDMSAGVGGSSSKDSDSNKRRRGEEDEMAADSANGSAQSKQKDKEAETKDGKEEYVHIRARRGQATNSHSLAERLRREKISERMRLLQDLVPGCSKVTGKAVMLDEIINYVQSLQRQVEFLSMKLAAVNPHLSMEGLLSKELLLRFPGGPSLFSSIGFPPEMLHPQLQLSQASIVQGGMPDQDAFRRAMQAHMGGSAGGGKDVGLQAVLFSDLTLSADADCKGLTETPCCSMNRCTASGMLQGCGWLVLTPPSIHDDIAFLLQGLERASCSQDQES